MFLTNREIASRREEIFPIAGQYDEEHLSQASYDLCIGDEIFLSENRIPNHINDGTPYVLLPPGQFALIKTFEQISVPPDLIGFLSIRSTYKFQGLINISGFHVDPTYSGNLIFAVQNVGPSDIRLRYREPVFMIMFAELKSDLIANKRKPGFTSIQLDQMAKLGGASITLAQLSTELGHLSLRLTIYGGIAVAVFVALIGLLLKLFLGK